MAYHYDDISGKEKELKYIPGYEIGYDIPIYLARDYPNYNNIGLINLGLNIGYYMGVNAAEENHKRG